MGFRSYGIYATTVHVFYFYLRRLCCKYCTVTTVHGHAQVSLVAIVLHSMFKTEQSNLRGNNNNSIFIARVDCYSNKEHFKLIKWQHI